MARLQLIYAIKYQAIQMVGMCLFKTGISYSIHLFMQICHSKANFTFPKKVGHKISFNASLIPVKIIQQHIGKQHSHSLMLLQKSFIFKLDI